MNPCGQEAKTPGDHSLRSIRSSLISLGRASGLARSLSINAALSQRLERFTSALRAWLSNFGWNRPGKVLHVTAGCAFPSKRPMFRRIAKKFQCLLRVVTDSLQNLPDSI
jgi:hypothetical protein